MTLIKNQDLTNKLRRRGLTSANFLDICVMCQKEEETINHLFLHCEFVANIWSHFIARCGVAWCCPESIVQAAQYWLGGCFGVCRRTLWRIIPFAILWTSWRERNDRIFRGISSPLVKLIEGVTLRIAKWAMVRKEFSTFSINNIFVNWEACMVCGLPKVRRSTLCSPPPLSVLKFNVDGATRGKPGPTGIGGVLHNNKGGVLFMFSKHVGVCD